MAKRRTSYWVRLVLLVGLLIVLGGAGVFLRRLGLGEIGIVVALVALVFVIESARFVLRQFLRGYQGRARRPDHIQGE
jgi:hypothetical protein